jgi:lipoyl(octanoyl) transferase
MNLQIVNFKWIKNLTYQDVWDIQTGLHQALVDKKLFEKRNPNFPISETTHHLIFCEHTPVYTLGKSGSMDHLLLSAEDLSNGNIEFFKINRGGDITFHGPGQITGYPILDLEYFFTDVHKYVRYLEDAVIILLQKYDIQGIRIPNYTGVWLEPNESDPKYRKICAIGVHMSRWVSMHGFALNINTDLAYFDKIIPCGIIDENKSVTSLAHETGKEYDLHTIGNELAQILSELFEFKLLY